MQVGRVIDIFVGIVAVAMAFVIVSSPNTADIIKAWGTAFSSSISAAMGGKVSG
jgi:hypothetical protein